MQFILTYIHLVLTIYQVLDQYEDTDINWNKSPVSKDLQSTFLGARKGTSALGILDRDSAEVAMSYPTTQGIN